jgi:hypothetical protein
MVDAPGYFFDKDIYFMVWTRSNVTVVHRFHYAESDVKKCMTISLTVRKIGEGAEFCFRKNNNIFLPVCVWIKSEKCVLCIESWRIECRKKRVTASSIG